MKVLILIMLTLFIGVAAKAQSGTAFLSITLTDIQSVKFNNTSSNSTSTREGGQKGSLEVLRESVSQVKTIQSTNLEYERLYKEIYSGAVSGPSSLSNQNLASAVVDRDPKARKSESTANLVIYQIDPR